MLSEIKNQKEKEKHKQLWFQFGWLQQIVFIGVKENIAQFHAKAGVLKCFKDMVSIT